VIGPLDRADAVDYDPRSRIKAQITAQYCKIQNGES
jgi:hypothetical protein